MPNNFLLQPGDPAVLEGKKLVPTADLKRAGVDGLTIRARPDWDTMFSFVDQQASRCKAIKKKYTLLVMGGFEEKPWLKGNVDDYCRDAKILGDYFSPDPFCYACHVTGCTPYGNGKSGPSEELYWKKETFTPAVEAANKKLITAWSAAFPRQKILLAVAGSYPEGMRRLIDYGQATAPGRFVVKINSLGPQTKLDAPQVKLLQYAASKGCGIGFEANAAWGSQADYNKAMGTWGQVEKLAGVKGSYAAYYFPDSKFLK